MLTNQVIMNSYNFNNAPCLLSNHTTHFSHYISYVVRMHCIHQLLSNTLCNEPHVINGSEAIIWGTVPVLVHAAVFIASTVQCSSAAVRVCQGLGAHHLLHWQIPQWLRATEGLPWPTQDTHCGEYSTHANTLGHYHTAKEYMYVRV